MVKPFYVCVACLAELCGFLPGNAGFLNVDIKKFIGYRKLQIVYSSAFQAVYGVITI